MNKNNQAIIAGLSLGSFMGMLLILFSLLAIPSLASIIVPLASLGVFLGAFAACLVTMTWVTTETATNRFLVTEMA